MNLDIIDYKVLGMQNSKSGVNWRKAFQQNKDILEGLPVRKWFAESIEFAYETLATIYIKDLDSSIEYSLKFDNSKRLWDVQLKNVKNPNEPDTEVDPKFKIDFMRDDFIKKIIAKVYTILKETLWTFEHIILQKINTGNYLDINETKLEAEIDMLKDQVLMSNLKKRLYIK